MQGQIFNADLNIGNATFNTIDGVINLYIPHSLTIAQDVKMLVDVDLANKLMDRFDASTYGNHTGNIIVDGMNLISDSQNAQTSILFAEEGLRNNVVTSITDVGNGATNNYQTTAYAPIYKYSVSYDENTGNFLFDRFGAGSSG